MQGSRRRTSPHSSPRRDPRRFREAGGVTAVPVVETSALGKRYGSLWALQDCSLAIPAGSVAALVGPNGAGKTTLLHLLIGLSEPSAGDVRVLGWSPREQPQLVLPASGSWPRSIRSTAASSSPRC